MPTPPLADDQLQEACLAVVVHGNITEAAEAMGIPRGTLRHRLSTARLRGIGPDGPLTDAALMLAAERAAKGYAPEAELNHPVAEGYEIHGYSHMAKDSEGRPLWIKTKAVRARWENIVTEAMSRIEAKPINIPPPKPQGFDAHDIIPWLNIGDAHIGMLAHQDETGANFDIKIATAEIIQASFDLIDRAPDCERMVINDLGDGTHYENFKAMTEASGHAVDFDTRFPKMIDAYYDILQAIIEKALAKADTVDVIINQGNHSRTNDIHAAQAISRIYANTNRVNVVPNENIFIGYRMGDTFILIHHTDKAKPPKLRDVMSTDFAADWGETKHRYIWGGHVHHEKVLELAGAKFQSWNNLAPMDKYAHDYAWRSKQTMGLALMSRKYGQEAVYTMPIEKVWDRIRETRPDHYVPAPRRAFTV